MFFGSYRAEKGLKPVEMDKKGSFAVAQNCAVDNLIWPICVEYPRHIGLLCKLQQHLRSMYQVYRV